MTTHTYGNIFTKMARTILIIGVVCTIIGSVFGQSYNADSLDTLKNSRHMSNYQSIGVSADRTTNVNEETERSSNFNLGSFLEQLGESVFEDNDEENPVMFRQKETSSAPLPSASNPTESSSKTRSYRSKSSSYDVFQDDNENGIDDRLENKESSSSRSTTTKSVRSK